MSIFKIQHITKYEYDRPIKESVNEIKIYPANIPAQKIIEHELKITGGPEIFTFQDYWGNKTGNFNLLSQHQDLVIESRLIIETEPNILGEFPTKSIENTTIDLNDLQLLQYTRGSAVSEKSFLESVLLSIYTPDKSIAALAIACSEFIYKNFTYIKGITTIETTVDEIIAHRAGVCQDFAHILLELLRTMQIPARYVSGYICPNKNGMRGEGATHAWVEFFIPDFGWVGIDPTNNALVGNHHVKLAVGRDFTDCTPIKGTFKGPAYQQLSVFVSVGYEDGMVFEEINNVQLEKSTIDANDNFINSFTVQQQ